TSTADFTKFAGEKENIDWSMSAQWASRPDDQRFENWTNLLDYLRHRTEMSRSDDINLLDMAPTLASGSLAFDAGFGALVPTNYSFEQISQACEMPTDFLRGTLGKRPDLVAECLKEGISHLDGEKPVKLYSSGTDLRALTSQKYGRILDLDVAEALFTAIEDSGVAWGVPTAFAMPGTVQNACVDAAKDQTTLYASDRDVCLFLVQET